MAQRHRLQLSEAACMLVSFQILQTKTMEWIDENVENGCIPDDMPLEFHTDYICNDFQRYLLTHASSTL